MELTCRRPSNSQNGHASEEQARAQQRYQRGATALHATEAQLAKDRSEGGAEEPAQTRSVNAAKDPVGDEKVLAHTREG